MNGFQVRIIGGFCGGKMNVVADHLYEVLKQAGYECKVTSQSVWESFTMPPAVDLVLQLLPAYPEDDGDVPIIYIKPLLMDLNHPETLQKIISTVAAKYPARV